MSERFDFFMINDDPVVLKIILLKLSDYKISIISLTVHFLSEPGHTSHW